MLSFKEQYESYRETVEATLKDACEAFSGKSKTLKDAMSYSLLLGGKRIRPVVLLATADLLGVSREDALPYAVPIEMIHTYSLIHDDLPAMDNDDFRRGKPSNHKVFGEAHAVLAGDALLNTAYELCFEQGFKGEKYLRAAKYLCEAAGEGGMIAGQSLDILAAEKEYSSEKELLSLHKLKTGKLLTAPFAIASILADGKNFLELEEFGYSLGLLFQLTDDILDVTGNFEAMGKTLGKDKEENKTTCVKIYGLQQAEVQADMCAAACTGILERMDVDVTFLRDLVYFIRTRKN